MRVLVVEDHAKLAMTVAAGLRQAGMAVDVIFDGHDALDRIAATLYDVVVLDRDLPGVHGDDVCRALVAEGAQSRILMLTAARRRTRHKWGAGSRDAFPRPDTAWLRETRHQTRRWTLLAIGRMTFTTTALINRNDHGDQAGAGDPTRMGLGGRRAYDPVPDQSMTRNITARTTRLAMASSPLGMNLRVLTA